jgi:hypothetical protein
MVPMIIKKSMQSDARTKIERLRFNGGLEDIWWNLSRSDAVIRHERNKQTEISRKNVVTRYIFWVKKSFRGNI